MHNNVCKSGFLYGKTLQSEIKNPPIEHIVSDKVCTNKYWEASATPNSIWKAPVRSSIQITHIRETFQHICLTSNWFKHYE